MNYLTCDKKYLYHTSLSMWANYIETGDPAMSADLAAKCGHADRIKALNDSQKQMVLRLREEAAMVL